MAMPPEWLVDGFFRSAIENSVDCIKVLDLDGRVQVMNRAGMRLMQLENFEMIGGKSWASIWPASARTHIDAGIDAGLRGEHFRFEAMVPTAHGDIKSWDVLVSPLRGHGGEIGALIVTCRDATSAFVSRCEAEASSRGRARSAVAIRSANRIAQLGGWEYDCATRQVLFSSELVDIIGSGGGGGGVGRWQDIADALRYWVEEDRSDFEKLLEDAAAFGKDLTFEGRILGPDGGIRWIRVMGEPQIVDGWCVALRGASQDITNWREAMDRLVESEQAAVRAREAMAGFLTTMSHELRTPLNGVLGMAQAMALSDLSDGQKQDLSVIRTSGEALLSLLNDLLDLSKIKAGKLELEEGVIDVQALVDNAQSFAVLAKARAIDFSVSLAPEARGLWRGDPEAVRRVLHNLLSNAVKFTERGAVAVDLSRAEDRLILRVRDTGIGIPQAKLTDIFESFVQVDPSATRRYGGSGLGLTICRDLVALMGGEIGVESTEGVGSTFTVSLPPSRLSPANELDAPLARLQPQGLRVLAAEDNPVNQLVLRTLLAAVGIDPVIVANGEEAVQAWNSGVWDVVLMDIQMPVRDGVSAVRLIRTLERKERRARTPVIALSANAMAHHQEQYLAAGMDDFVAKPINLDQLLQAIDRALSLGEQVDGCAVSSA